MNPSLVWDNLVAYSLQIGLLVGLAAFVPAVLRLRQAKARLFYWYLLLATCLAMPALRPWRQETIINSTPADPPVLPMTPVHTAPHRMPRSEMGLLLLAAGAAVRLAWLAAGFWKLRRYRRHSHPLGGAPAWSVNADLRVSEDIASPVTFGYLHPVILLPAQFPDLDHAKQDAILCHEVVHVWRRDWLFTLAEEMVRAVFWFHPAIWWLLGEIQLAREQAVDREVIALTRKRDEYVDALLAIAGAPMHLDLAPAPLFLRRRHLKERVVSILKERRMSKTRLISAFALSLALMAGACWFVTGTFPLAAEPQMVNDAPGVSVDTGGAPLIHRAGVNYPITASRDRIEGTVVVQVKLGPKGDVVDASVLSGPDELRKNVLANVLDWHFAHETANSTRQIRITFQVPKTEPSSAPVVVQVQPQPGTVQGVVGGVPGGVSGGVRSGVIGGIIGSVPSAGVAMRGPVTEGTVKSIVVTGIGDQAKAELMARLPIHEGETLTPDTLKRVAEAVHDYDEHLSVAAMGSNGSDVTLQISAPRSGTFAVAAQPVVPPGAIRVGGNEQQTKLTSQPRPVYPPLAKQARISGVVHLYALIGKDGGVKNLQVISGHPLLVQAAMEAVQQWTYEPTLLNGQPVEVVTQIDVNFTLSQ